MINFNINNKNTNIDTDYDYETYQELKKVPDASYDMNNDTWIINTDYLKHLIKNLNDMDKDVSSVIPELKNITSNKKYNSLNHEEIIKTVRINVVKENPKSLVIGFDYDEKVLELVKQIEGRSYVKQSKSWRIDKGNEDWLYNKLSELGYVDLTNLLPYTSYNSKDQKLLAKSDFPYLKIDPYKFQMDAVNQLVNQKKVINALEAGLGKTPITAMACDYIDKQVLVIAPATVKYNWEKEIYKVNPYADVSVLDGKSQWTNSQYIIINYEIIDTFIDDIYNSNIEVVVFDEAHKLRGVNNRGEPSSKRAKFCVSIAKDMEYVFPITATPFLNQTKDIFNLLKVIEHPSTNNWYAFANTYCGATETGFGINYNGSSNQGKLNSRLYPNYMIRMKTDDYIELPERTRNFIPVNINMSKYNKAINDYMNNRKSLETKGDHLVYLMAMRKELASAKVKHAIKMTKDLLEQNKSVVLFTNYTDVADTLSKQFKDNVAKVTGDIEPKERQRLIDDFQEGNKKVFVGNIDAAGEGVTLTTAYHMIVVDYHWSPVVMVNQMEKRIHRISQTQPSIINYLYVPEAKIDQVQLDMLEEKLNDSSLIIDGKKEEFFTQKIINEFN